MCLQTCWSEKRVYIQSPPNDALHGVDVNLDSAQVVVHAGPLNDVDVNFEIAYLTIHTHSDIEKQRISHYLLCFCSLHAAIYEDAHP